MVNIVKPADVDVICNVAIISRVSLPFIPRATVQQCFPFVDASNVHLVCVDQEHRVEGLYSNALHGEAYAEHDLKL